MSRRAPLFLSIALALLTGCASRIAPHDEAIAAGLTALRSSHTRFFDELHETAGTPDAGWDRHLAWYEETYAAIDALRSRAAAYGMKKDPTLAALDLLHQSVTQLEAIHAQGLSRGEIPVLRTLFDSQLHMLIELEKAKREPAEVAP